MEVGLQNRKIGFVIQARMNSSRLPGKILLPIPLGNGKPLLGWIVEYLRTSKLDAGIIIATSQNEENDTVEAFCKELGVSCFRGEEDDVLSRFQTIINQENYETVVRLTADNPFIDVDILEKTINYHITNNLQYTKTEGMPIGMNFEIIEGNTLIDMGKRELSSADKEHVTLFIRNNDIYKRGVYQPEVRDGLERLRLSIDYPSDFTLASTILELSNHNLASVKPLALIESIFENYSWLFNSNIDNIQR